ncbi:MAG: hypothetical protein RIC82_06610 [Parvibaculum sp.]
MLNDPASRRRALTPNATLTDIEQVASHFANRIVAFFAFEPDLVGMALVDPTFSACP